MSDVEKPWVQRKRSGPPSSCPVCGAATRKRPDGVVTCTAWGEGDFEWRPDEPPVVSVPSERADKMRCISCGAVEQEDGAVWHNDPNCPRVLTSGPKRVDAETFERLQAKINDTTARMRLAAAGVWPDSAVFVAPTTFASGLKTCPEAGDVPCSLADENPGCCIREHRAATEKQLRLTFASGSKTCTPCLIGQHGERCLGEVDSHGDDTCECTEGACRGEWVELGFTTVSDNDRYDKSLTIPLPEPRPDGYRCTHDPRCRDRRTVGDPEWTATEMACGRVETEGPDDSNFADVDLGEYLEQARLDVQHLAHLTARSYDWRTRETADHRPLTAEQVAQLPEGAPVTVIWSGGNGPHDYVVTIDALGTRYAWSQPFEERMRFYNQLRFVGRAQFHTRVWLREAPAGPPPVEGELIGYDFTELVERRLQPQAAELASLHRPVFGRPPYCWACTAGGKTNRVGTERRVAWPCSTASLALGMMGMTASEIAITEE